MKSFAIRLSAVQAAMLLEVLKASREYRNLQGFVVAEIEKEFDKIFNDQRARKSR